MQKAGIRPAVAKDLARYEKQSEEEKQRGLKQEYQPRGDADRSTVRIGEKQKGRR